MLTTGGKLRPPLVALMAAWLRLGPSVCSCGYRRRLRITRVLSWSQGSNVDHSGAFVATGVV